MIQFLYLFNQIILNDAAEPWQLGFQDSALYAVLLWLLQKVYHTIFWNFLTNSYSSLLLETINWILFTWVEQSVEKIEILRDYTYELYSNYGILKFYTFVSINIYLALLFWRSVGYKYLKILLVLTLYTLSPLSTWHVGWEIELFNLQSSLAIVSCSSIGQNFNLSWSLGSKKLTKEVRKMFILPPAYEGILVGLLLSDAGINKSKSNKLMRIAFVQSFTLHFHYFMHVYFSLSFIFRSLPILRIQYRRGIKNVSLSIISMGLPAIHNLCLQILDVNGRKIIPIDIYNLLTPIALAHWIMGDGEAREYGLRLCTDAFSIKEVVTLMNVLLIRYNIQSSIFWKKTPTGLNPRITIPSSELNKLVPIVLPFMIPQMLYKIKL